MFTSIVERERTLERPRKGDEERSSKPLPGDKASCKLFLIGGALGSLQYPIILGQFLQQQRNRALTTPHSQEQLPTSPAFSPASARTPKFLYSSSTPADCSAAIFHWCALFRNTLLWGREADERLSQVTKVSEKSRNEARSRLQLRRLCAAFFSKLKSRVQYQRARRDVNLTRARKPEPAGAARAEWRQFCIFDRPSPDDKRRTRMNVIKWSFSR